jgi:hypothetical protein
MVHKLNARYKYRMASYLLRCGREQHALLELEDALMAERRPHHAAGTLPRSGGTCHRSMHLLELVQEMNFSLPHIPTRTLKPREAGLTMVMDKGLSIRQAEDMIDACGTFGGPGEDRLRHQLRYAAG